MKVSIIGLGRMGVRLAAAAEAAGQQVVAVLDSAEQPWGLQQRPDLAAVVTADAEAFWAVPTDIVVIATTAPSHVPLLLESLKRGVRRIVVEKPFATSVAEARQGLAAAAAVGARVVVNHPRRFNPNFIALRGLDGGPELGRLRSVRATLGGGSMGCLGVHFFDLFNWLFDAMPESVTATLTEPLGANVRGERFCDPGGTVFLTYPGGRRAFLDIGDDLAFIGGMQFFFELGRVAVDAEFGPWEILARKPEDRQKPFSQYGLPLERNDAVLPWQDVAMPDLWAAVLKDAASADTPVVGGALGLESVQVFAAARHAAATGTRVRFPLSEDAEAEVYPIP
ncbi:Gfo/Idh/MocA family protein [Novispirillum sp. DQ9]|uniref:Gfo/Idh/MocA family protein n=1 Tax=Novispirillum sp. DQ9 TaxID=3398612 RepID=UPI003C7C3450